MRDALWKNPFSMEKLALLVPIINISILPLNPVSYVQEVETMTKQPKLVIALKLLLFLQVQYAFNVSYLNTLTFKKKNV